MARARTLYDILEVIPTASPQVIRASYRSLAQQYHPDKTHGDKAAEEKLKEVNTAYEILSDPARRSAYDAGLGHASDMSSTSQGTMDDEPLQSRSTMHGAGTSTDEVVVAGEAGAWHLICHWFPKAATAKPIDRAEYWSTLIVSQLVLAVVYLPLAMMLYEITRTPALASTAAGLVATYVFLRMWLHIYIGRAMHIGWWGTQGLKNLNYAVLILWLFGLLSIAFLWFSYLVALIGMIVIGCRRGLLLADRPLDSVVTEQATKVEPTYAGPLGTCPNCEASIPLPSESCPRCNAVFGTCSSWQIKPLT